MLPDDTSFITDEASLRTLHHAPMRRATDKVLRGLDQHCRRIISLSPFCIIATQDQTAPTSRPAGEPDNGLIIAPNVVTFANSKLIIALAARHRLPAIYPFAFYAKEGGLLSYGFDALDQFRQGAVYVDKILRGAKPAELPVQHPTKFEMVINLKTARALGLDVSAQLQQLADDVIE
ncbi:MAG TPA: ABC transporter substrate binding protein [Xanthobacteraceae bacterium]